MILTSVLLLAACGGGGNYNASLSPMPDPVDPTDAQMRASVLAFLTDTGAPVSSMYDFQRLDLDEDGRRDALVLFKNPYGYWCDTHGCTMLVLKAKDETFELVNAIQPVRGPLYVSEANSNGWRDIIIRVSGRWDQTKDVAVKFDGNQYPDNPAMLPAYMRVASAGGVRVFR